MIINEQSKLDFLDVAKLAAAVADCSYAMVIFKQEKSFEIQATFGESIGIDCDLEVFKQILRTGQPLHIEDLNEYSCLERPGALKNIRFFLGVPILSSSAEVQGILAVMHEEPIRLKGAQVDLVETLSHQVSNILIERLKMQELNRFSKMMEEIHLLNNNSGSVDSLFDEYLRKGLQILGLEFGIISGIYGGVYTVDYVICPEDAIKTGACFAVGDTYCSSVVERAETVFLDHVGCDEVMRTHPAYKAMKLESYIGTPIHYNGEIIGTLNFSSLKVRKYSYSKEEVKFVEILAQMISSKIEKLESDKTLAENAEWVNMAISGSGVAFWAFDSHKQIIQINKGVTGLFDVNGGVIKVSLADWIESIYPPDQKKVLEAFNGVKNGMLDVSLEFRKEVGDQIRHLKVVGRVREGGWTINNKVFGASWDITNQKNKEAELEDSLKQFQTLTELAPIGIFLTDANGGAKYLNQRWLNMSGLNREQGEGTGWGQALHEDDREDVFNKWEKIVKNGEEWNRNFRIRNVIDGQVTHVHTKATPLKDSEGITTGYIGINLDITEQLELEEQLLSNVKQLESFIGSIPSGVAMFDKEMRYKAASKKWLKDCGLEGQDVIGVCHYDLNRTLPERWKQGHREALNGAWLSCTDDSYIKSDG
ncbi:MAG: GAF domain-containing protein, partial [Bacteriovoracaceae bacterium]|nr:GAF domain-containing protein [Bacteriovoracaceae bacterium]